MSTPITTMDGKHKKAQQYLNSHQLREARDLYADICAEQPGDIKAHLWLGKLLFKEGDLAGASEAFATCVNLDDEHDEAYLLLGECLLNAGQHEAALACYERAIQLNQDNYPQLLDTGKALIQQNIALAISFLDKACSLQPANAIAHAHLAQAVMFAGDSKAAQALFEKAIQLEPNNAGLYANLGYLLNETYQFAEAIGVLEKALSLQPENIAALHNMATVLFATGQYTEAEKFYRKALKMNPSYSLSQRGLVTTLLKTGQYEKTLYECNRLLKQTPDDTTLIATRAQAQDRSGLHDEALTSLTTLFNHGSQDNELLKSLLTIAKAEELDDSVISAAKNLLSGNTHMNRRQLTELHFALGKALDKRKDYDAAFLHYSQGNKLKSLSYDHATFKKEVDDITQVFSSAFFSKIGTSTCTNDKLVFIVGMPRSGTSLVEQILATHPDVYGAGELYTLNRLAGSICHDKVNMQYPYCLANIQTAELDKLATDYLREVEGLVPTGKKRLTDKMPHNFLRIGLIAVLFPKARIIHIQRNALDNCLSCYFQDFVGSHNYSYDLEDLGHYYLEYQRLMQHWRKVLPGRFLDVEYENLVNTPEEVIKQMLDHCGLPWDAACLTFYENDRVTVTASQDQVTQPIYNKSIGRWHHYESHLGELIKILNPGS